jgi:hypothetical protein
MFTAAKDAMTSQAAMIYINRHLVPYGRVAALKIDSQDKSVEVSCVLNGETAPIGITLKDYVVKTEGQKKFIQVGAFSCTRPWLQSLLTDFGRDRRIELPPWAAALL